MRDDTRIDFFATALAEICAHSLIAPGKQLRWMVIANPAAGGFTMRSRWEKCRLALEKCVAAAKENPLREGCTPANTAVQYAFGLVTTEGPGSATKFANDLIDEAKANTVPIYILITAGGDGTSLEVLSALYHASESVRSNMAVLRLPLGTGNDGADSPELAGALELLISPSRVELTPALRLLTAPGGNAESKGPFLAFNILSVGLDAYVTHMTNKMKGKLPGDFYKLWVDIASLLYDRLYNVDFLDVKALDGQGSEVRSFREKVLLLAVGVSGHRTYGSQKKVLPDDRNVCAIRQMSLLRKLVFKEYCTTGKHIDEPESQLFNAHRVEFTGDFPMLAQMDGETVLLQKEDFPAAIELTDPVIPVLKLVGR